MLFFKFWVYQLDKCYNKYFNAELMILYSVGEKLFLKCNEIVIICKTAKTTGTVTELSFLHISRYKI